MRQWGKPTALGLGLGWALSILIFYTSTVGSPVDAWCYWGAWIRPIPTILTGVSCIARPSPN